VSKTVVSLCCVLALLAGGCGDDGNAAEPAVGSTVPTTVGPTTTLAPVKGGSITVGVLTEIAGLDPTMLTSSGTTGGIEAAAIYDTVVRFDPQTKRYEGRTAASIEPNADYTQWTVRLKPNIRFTDGTAYDADAVKFNVDRHTAAASRSSSKAILTTFLQSTTVVDPLTIRFTLKQSWPAFPFVLTQNVGMIASPAAVQKAGADFNRNPGAAGAGPFELVSYKPKESIIVRRNAAYYGGEVYLDQITFIAPGSSGDSGRLDALNTGTLQAAVLSTDPAVIANAKAKYPSIDRYSFGGSIVLMNSGVELTCQGGNPAGFCAGKVDGTKVRTQPPTADLRVRKAVVAAIDTRVVNDRAWSGKGLADSALLPKQFPWDPGLAGSTYDAAEAKRLVDEVKRATGWDGTIRVLSSNDPVSTTLAITVKTLLEAVGMRVELSNQKDGQAMISQVVVDRDFDLVVPWSLSISDDDGAYNSIFSNLNSPGARTGYTNVDMDAAIDSLRQASTDDTKRAAYKRITEVFNRDAPSAVLAARVTAIAHSPKLQGFQQSAAAIVLLDKVWLSA
jgi:peptide/nickel transport system substrate-binding protein